jgi:adenylate cyclase
MPFLSSPIRGDDYMESEGFKRKLTAILSADVVGYSRLMGENEERTIRFIKTYRKLISSLTDKHHGRVVDSPGDNLLAEFNSVIDAVRCAVEIQEEISERNAEILASQKMEYRIGINIGDVVDEEGRIYGDGVNIAARLESLAEPGGICISGFVYNQVKNRLKLEYEYLGEQSVKNIKEPIPVYRVLSFPGAAAHRVIEAKKVADSVSMASAVKDKPSIAVLPFANISSDPEQEYFVDGLSEEILNSLCQIPDLTVIARTSSFSFKGKDKTIPEIASVLGVENILEGSVRKAGNSLRITSQLVKAVDGSHLWSKTYKRELRDIFEVQEDIATAVSDELKLKLGIGQSLKQLGGTDNEKAYELYLFAKEQYIRAVAEYSAKLLDPVDEALALDPDFALAWVLKASIIFSLTMNMPANQMEAMNDEAIKAIQKAIEIEPNLPDF